jgi:prepilin-type N-terminal cleavage/methylation domain-containing protein
MKLKKSEAGFTIVELLIAIALFGLVVPSIILSILSLNQINDRASDLTVANILAENKVESIRSAGYNTLTNGSTVDFTSELPNSFTAPKSANYTVSEPQTGLKKIDIAIQYTDRGVSRTLNYSTLMSELGVSQ